MPNWEEIQKEWDTTKITLAALALQLEDLHLIWRMMSVRGREYEPIKFNMEIYGFIEIH